MIIPNSVYISGPITGMPNNNVEAFATRAKLLREQGYYVVNPHELTEDQSGHDWTYYMRVDIIELCKCEMINMLPGWQKSRGANIEYGMALQLGLRVIEL